MPVSGMITRRVAVLAATCIAIGSDFARAAAEPMITAEDFPTKDASIKVHRYATRGLGKRPAVLLLHGSKGLKANFEAYDRYARDLAASGIDTLLFSYFQPEELKVINEARDGSARHRQYIESIDRWVSLVRSIADSAREHERNSGHVGLLGFSLGGFVAVAAASKPLFSVLTVFYAGLPTFYNHAINFLPPLLDIHGDADRAVSLSQGERLVTLAKRLGGVAELALFRNEGHGFDLDIGNRDAASARQRAIAFTSQWLA